MNNKSYQHVSNLWDSSHAANLDPVAQLIYRSNLLGNDQRITNTGGGNTSAKLAETDPLTGESVEVLWVKGSGGDLRTSKRENFASLYLDKVLSLESMLEASPEKGPKAPVEDQIVARYPHCTFNLNPRAASIDTPLHAFIPHRHVDHTHPNAVISIAASDRSEELTKEIYGDDVIWTPWQRPGLSLGLTLREVCRKHPQARGVILGQHGLINWAETAEECYLLTLDLIEKAADFIQSRDLGEKTFGGARYTTTPDETSRRALLVSLLPWLRGQVSQNKRFIGTVQDDPTILRFVNSHDAPRLAELGTSCPDHFLRTKIKPLYVEWDPASGDFDQLRNKLTEGLAAYREDYRAYHEACKHADSPAVRDPNPTVILIPGLGMIAWGKDKSESRVTAEFYNCAVEVMRGAETVDRYIALPRQEAFDIEYWALEEAKLRRMPAEKELARQVVVIVGAGSGIGRGTGHRLIREGAHIVCADLNGEAATTAAAEIQAPHGPGIGVAGTGISNCGPAIGLQVDVTKRESIRACFDQTVLAYGGIDHVIVTAGIVVSPDADGRIPDDKWALTYAINVTGSYLVADEARPVWEEQSLPGTSLVLTSSANALVVKKGSTAYDTSKAALNHLVRELAMELSPGVRVNAVAPATVIEGSGFFPRERVVANLAKYNIAFQEDESDEALIGKLAQFYADRTLTKAPIRLSDQAEAYFLLVSNRLTRTTGQILAVDGGLHEAFLR